MELSFDSSEVVVTAKRPNLAGFTFAPSATQIREAGRAVATVSRKKKAGAVAADDNAPPKRVKTVPVPRSDDPPAKKLLSDAMQAGAPSKKSKEKKDRQSKPGSNLYDRERRREMLEEARAAKAVEGNTLPEVPLITDKECFEFDEAKLAKHLAGGR